MSDERIHCDRRRLRGSPLRKNYCQTAAEYAVERTLREVQRNYYKYPRRSPIITFQRLPVTANEANAAF